MPSAGKWRVLGTNRPQAGDAVKVLCAASGRWRKATIARAHSSGRGSAHPEYKVTYSDGAGEKHVTLERIRARASRSGEAHRPPRGAEGEDGEDDEDGAERRGSDAEDGGPRGGKQSSTSKGSSRSSKGSGKASSKRDSKQQAQQARRDDVADAPPRPRDGARRDERRRDRAEAEVEVEEEGDDDRAVLAAYGGDGVSGVSGGIGGGERSLEVTFEAGPMGFSLERQPDGTAFVVRLVPGGAAARAGITIGDAVQALDGRAIDA